MRDLVPSVWGVSSAKFFVLAIVLFFLAGCEARNPAETDTGKLQVAFSGPTDFETLNVEIFASDSCRGEIVEARVLGVDDTVALFEKLKSEK